MGNLRVDDVAESCGSSDVEGGGGDVDRMGGGVVVVVEVDFGVVDVEVSSGSYDVGEGGGGVVMGGVGFVGDVESEGSPEVGLMEESCGSLDVDGSVAGEVVLVVAEELVVEGVVLVVAEELVAEGVVLVVVEELVVEAVVLVVAEELEVVGLTEEFSDVDVSRAAVIVVGDWSVCKVESDGSIEEPSGSSDVDMCGSVVEAGVVLDCAVESETPTEVGLTEESCGSSDVDVFGAAVTVAGDWFVCKEEEPTEVGSIEESCGSSDVDVSGAAVVEAGVWFDCAVESDNPTEVGSLDVDGLGEVVVVVVVIVSQSFL